MKIAIGVVIFVIFTWGIVSIFSSDEWLPIYYPNPSDLTTHVNGPTVDTLNECRDWVDAESIRREQAIGAYDYECGLNCKLDSDYGLFVCEDTLE